MKKSDNCKLFRKYTKKDAAHTITKFFKKTLGGRPKNAAHIITKFFKNTSNRRRALFLKSI